MKNIKILGTTLILILATVLHSQAYATFYAYCIDGKVYKPPLTDEVKARPDPGLNPDDATDKAVILAHPFIAGNNLCN